MTEINDPLVATSFVLSAVLNSLIAFQMILYWDNASPTGLPTRRLSALTVGEKAAGSGWGAEEKGVGMPASPGQTTPTTGSFKKWARKVD